MKPKPADDRGVACGAAGGDIPVMANEDSDRLGMLETRYAFLERHVAEQDRAMLEMAKRIDLLEARLKQLHGRVERGSEGSTMPDERPPHY